jgi:hypothetical protein
LGLKNLIQAADQPKPAALRLSAWRCKALGDLEGRSLT